MGEVETLESTSLFGSVLELLGHEDAGFDPGEPLLYIQAVI